jgi:Domain of unknown function (DUF1707)
MTRHESLRASDADREAVIEQLRKAAAEGRLEPEELEERVEDALRARTYGELAPLVADLPGPSVARGRPRSPARPVATLALTTAAAIVALAAIAIVVLVAVALTAAWWIGCVLFWLVCCRPRRLHRTRPAGLI